jgi:tetratricopeptide (TPR) repeat protein
VETTSTSPREQGIAALDAGDLDRAVELLSQAVLRDTRDAEARARLGLAYGRKGRPDQARRALESALILQPENPDYLCLLGAQFEREGDTAAAAGAYRRALGFRPDHPTAAARLELIGLEPRAEPPPPPPPPPPTPRPPAPSPQQARATCRNCGELSQPGVLCEWCGTSLATGVRPPEVGPTLVTPTPLVHSTLLPPAIPLVHRRPHRGGAVLTLGILSLLFTLGSPCVFPAFLALGCGIAATVMGGRDLADIRAGVAQDYGIGPLQAGRILGILGAVGAGLALMGWFVLLLSYAVVGF